MVSQFTFCWQKFYLNLWKTLQHLLKMEFRGSSLNIAGIRDPVVNHIYLKSYEKTETMSNS